MHDDDDGFIEVSRRKNKKAFFKPINQQTDKQGNKIFQAAVPNVQQQHVQQNQQHGQQQARQHVQQQARQHAQQQQQNGQRQQQHVHKQQLEQQHVQHTPLKNGQQQQQHGQKQQHGHQQQQHVQRQQHLTTDNVQLQQHDTAENEQQQHCTVENGEQNIKGVGPKRQKKKQKAKNKKNIPVARFLKNMLWAKQKSKQAHIKDILKKPEQSRNKDIPENITAKEVAQNIIKINRGINEDEDPDSQGSSSEGVHKGHMSPITADTECLQQKGGTLVIDFGSLEYIPPGKQNRHGTEIEHDSDQEHCYDTSEDEIEGISSDEEVPDSFLDVTKEEEAQILDSLTEIFAPSPKDNKDPISHEMEEIIQQQGLSPRGNKNKKGKNINKEDNTVLLENFEQSGKVVPPPKISL
ncbi:uncharacterized protein LOC132602009 [Lycium barbarum]|uniref:uncharacterized protein LOC132602009 n=1 Tax=Lycium barbarum TaxID=112863 RepID=UPI00293F04EF|nr:uncharacterized protein LOC132602009 [Lycium barbarum]